MFLLHNNIFFILVLQYLSHSRLYPNRYVDGCRMGKRGVIGQEGRKEGWRVRDRVEGEGW